MRENSSNLYDTHIDNDASNPFSFSSYSKLPNNLTGRGIPQNKPYLQQSYENTDETNNDLDGSIVNDFSHDSDSESDFNYVFMALLLFSLTLTTIGILLITIQLVLSTLDRPKLSNLITETTKIDAGNNIRLIKNAFIEDYSDKRNNFAPCFFTDGDTSISSSNSENSSEESSVNAFSNTSTDGSSKGYSNDSFC